MSVSRAGVWPGLLTTGGHSLSRPFAEPGIRRLSLPPVCPAPTQGWLQRSSEGTPWQVGALGRGPTARASLPRPLLPSASPSPALETPDKAALCGSFGLASPPRVSATPTLREAAWAASPPPPLLTQCWEWGGSRTARGPGSRRPPGEDPPHQALSAGALSFWCLLSPWGPLLCCAQCLHGPLLPPPSLQQKGGCVCVCVCVCGGGCVGVGVWGGV